MPLVKDPSYGKESPAAQKTVPKISITRPLPKKEDALIALITSLIKNRKLIYLRVNHREINYDYLADDIAEEALQWLMGKG